MSKLRINSGGVNSYKQRRLSSILLFIFAYAILITGSIYAYLSISASKNNVTAQAGCFDVNY